MRILGKTILCGLVLLQTLDVVLLQALPVRPVKCPSWPEVAKNCTYFPCNEDEGICYMDLDVKETGLIGKATKATLCCRIVDRFCNATGMLTFHNSPDALFEHIKVLMWNETIMDKNLYYPDTRTLAGCPFPYSYDTFQFKQQLPSFFYTTRITPVPNCKTNADCRHDEYCGQAYNAAYHGKDRSNNGTPMMFCYPTPNLPVPFEIAAKNKRDVGLPICRSDRHCYLDSICYTLPGNKIVYAAPDDMGYGICADVQICNGENMAMVKAVRTSNSDFGPERPLVGSCLKDEECHRNDEFWSPYYVPECRQITPFYPENKTASLCCYQKRPLCDYGYRIPGDIKCNTNADCNKEEDMGYWEYWCDRTGGVCCTALPKPYPGEDKPRPHLYKVIDHNEYRCQDMVTYIYAEEPCIDVNRSDPFSGRCPISDSALCKNGHCCPDTREALNEDGLEEVITSNTTYISNNNCDPEKLLSDGFYNAYCDFNRQTIIVVSASEAEKASDRDCLRPSECSAGETCIRIDTKISKCFEPLNLHTTTTEVTTTTVTSIEDSTFVDVKSHFSSFFNPSSSSTFSSIIGFFVLLVFIF